MSVGKGIARLDENIKLRFDCCASDWVIQEVSWQGHAFELVDYPLVLAASANSAPDQIKRSPSISLLGVKLTDVRSNLPTAFMPAYISRLAGRPRPAEAEVCTLFEVFDN